MFKALCTCIRHTFWIIAGWGCLIASFFVVWSVPVGRNLSHLTKSRQASYLIGICCVNHWTTGVIYVNNCGIYPGGRKRIRTYRHATFPGTRKMILIALKAYTSSLCYPMIQICPAWAPSQRRSKFTVLLDTFEYLRRSTNHLTCFVWLVHILLLSHCTYCLWRVLDDLTWPPSRLHHQSNLALYGALPEARCCRLTGALSRAKVVHLYSLYW